MDEMPRWAKELCRWLAEEARKGELPESDCELRVVVKDGVILDIYPERRINRRHLSDWVKGSCD